MKLSYAFALATAGVVGAAGMFAVEGCSSSKSTSPGGGGNSSLGAPPTIPTTAAPTTAGSSKINFAVYDLFLGDTDNGDTTFTQDQNAWENIGYNLDGVNTVSATSGVSCTPKGSNQAVTDGTNGIDNSFGYNVAPIITQTLGYTSQKISVQEIQAGAFTITLNVSGIAAGAAAATQTATGLSAGVFAGGDYATDVDAGAPTFTSATVWPVEPSLVVGGTAATAPYTSEIVFSSAGIDNGLFISGAPQPITLSLALGGVSLSLTVQHAIITFQVGADGTAGKGVIAGVLKTADLISALQQVGGSINNGSYCSTVNSLIGQLNSFSDIMSDGSAGAGKTCDGISIGLGFTAKPIAQPSTLAPGAGDAGAVSCGAVDAG